MAHSHADFSALRVLALQYHSSPQGPQWPVISPDLALLSKDGRPVTLVVRLDGQLAALPTTELWQRLDQLLARAHQQQIPLAGIEIDYDCARSQLAVYRDWLAQLRRQLPPDLPLGITALPDWLQSSEFGPLSAQTDQLTLQLHAVLSPRQGLFDSTLARQWAEKADALSQSPLYLALPAYHSALIDTADGWRVESEMPLRIAGTRRELPVDPAGVQQWLQELQQARTEGQFRRLQGLVWFRLPLDTDRRSWPYATLQAVVRGEPLQSQLSFSLQGDQPPFQLMVENRGNLSAPLPALLQFSAKACLDADGLQGYHLRQQGSALQLQRPQPLHLAPGRTLALAWLHCAQVQAPADLP